MMRAVQPFEEPRVTNEKGMQTYHLVTSKEKNAPDRKKVNAVQQHAVAQLDDSSLRGILFEYFNEVAVTKCNQCESISDR